MRASPKPKAERISVAMNRIRMIGRIVESVTLLSSIAHMFEPTLAHLLGDSRPRPASVRPWRSESRFPSDMCPHAFDAGPVVGHKRTLSGSRSSGSISRADRLDSATTSAILHGVRETVIFVSPDRPAAPDRARRRADKSAL